MELIWIKIDVEIKFEGWLKLLKCDLLRTVHLSTTLPTYLPQFLFLWLHLGDVPPWISPLMVYKNIYLYIFVYFFFGLIL